MYFLKVTRYICIPTYIQSSSSLSNQYTRKRQNTKKSLVKFTNALILIIPKINFHHYLKIIRRCKFDLGT